MWGNLADPESRKRVLIGSYLLAGTLFLVAAFYVTPEVYRLPVLFGGAGLVLAFLASRFLSAGDGIGSSRSFLFTITTLIAAAAIVQALTQVTPNGGARQFVLFAALGLAAGLVGWRLFSDRRPLVLGNVGKETARDRDIRWTRDTLLIWCYAGGFGLLLLAIRGVVPAGRPEMLFRTLGAGIVLSCGAMLAGVFVGFLFGIPRSPAGSNKKEKESGQAGNGEVGGSNQTGSMQAAFEVNTNLEQISDWLTKIIVGLGLINLKSIPAYLRDLSSYFAASFGEIPGKEAFTLALIITFGICGFLLGYLFTRLFLTGAFVRALTPEEKFDQEIQNAAQSTQGASSSMDPQAAEGGAQAPWDSDQVAAAAQRASDAATSLDRNQVRSRVLTLANQYNATRASMGFTPERTRRLDAIAASMRVLYKSAGWMLPELLKSDSAGERVAAIAFLQMEPKLEHLEWLANRFPADQPFVMYHAAIALQNAANSLPSIHRKVVRSVVELALTKVPESEPNTNKILSDTLKEIPST